MIIYILLIGIIVLIFLNYWQYYENIKMVNIANEYKIKADKCIVRI
jgi:hypothetical protein